MLKLKSFYLKLIFEKYFAKKIECLPQTLDFHVPISLKPKPLIFQTMNYVGSNNLSLEYQWFTPSGCTDKGIRKYKLMTKTQFLSQTFLRLV